MVQTAGAWDPAAGVGVGFRFESTSPFSGVHDTTLNNLLNEAQAVTNLSQRCSLYNQAAAYIAKNYYGPFYFAYVPANVAVKNVTGPGITTPLPTASRSSRPSCGRTWPTPADDGKTPCLIRWFVLFRSSSAHRHRPLARAQEAGAR
jgi:peptide/nickel transport system substrate-binding protein